MILSIVKSSSSSSSFFHPYQSQPSFSLAQIFLHEMLSYLLRFHCAFLLFGPQVCVSNYEFYLPLRWRARLDRFQHPSLGECSSVHLQSLWILVQVLLKSAIRVRRVNPVFDNYCGTFRLGYFVRAFGYLLPYVYVLLYHCFQHAPKRNNLPWLIPIVYASSCLNYSCIVLVQCLISFFCSSGLVTKLTLAIKIYLWFILGRHRPER